MYDLEQVIKANTVDDVIDFEKVMASVDEDYVNPIVAKKTDKEKLSLEAVSSIIKDLGIEGENLKDLKTYVETMGGSSDEYKEDNIKLTKSLEELTGKYDAEVESRTKLESETKLTSQLNDIRKLGVSDQTELEFLHFKFNKDVTEDKDFTAVLAEYAKANGVKTNAKYVKDDFGVNAGSVVIGSKWADRNAKRTGK